jgi:hypothetical protein
MLSHAQYDLPRMREMFGARALAMRRGRCVHQMRWAMVVNEGGGCSVHRGGELFRLPFALISPTLLHQIRELLSASSGQTVSAILLFARTLLRTNRLRLADLRGRLAGFARLLYPRISPLHGFRNLFSRSGAHCFLFRRSNRTCSRDTFCNCRSGIKLTFDLGNFVINVRSFRFESFQS